MSPFTDYVNYDGLALAELVRTKQVTALEVVEAAIARIEQENPALNAVVVKLYDQARGAAQAPLPDGPFMGVPFLVKDFWAMMHGVPTSNGNRLLAQIPRGYDSEMIRRWKAAGVIILGKTNTPEFASTPATEPEVFGPTRNPWDLSRSPAGSSGGSAAAVAARMVPIASGSDGGGSIRMPASCCGLFGLKISRGRTPSGPYQGQMWAGLGIEHVISRTVRDSAAMLDATHGVDVGAPYAAPPPARPFLAEVSSEPGRLRIAVTDTPFFGGSADPECRAGVKHTVQLLESLGHDVVADAPVFDGEACAMALMAIVAAQVRTDIVETARMVGRKPRLSDAETSNYALGLYGAAIPANVYVNAWRTLEEISRSVGRFFERYDLLLTPTLAKPPLPIGAFDLTVAERRLLSVVNRLGAGWVFHIPGVIQSLIEKAYSFMAYTPLFNITGQPAMSVPLYWSSNGLPIGMQFAARYGDEATLLRLAGQLEQAKPW